MFKVGDYCMWGNCKARIEAVPMIENGRYLISVDNFSIITDVDAKYLDPIDEVP